MKIHSSLPVHSALYKESENSSYKDSIRISTKRDDVQSWELVAAFFHSAPVWMRYLMSLRNIIVKRFGLRAGSIDENEIIPPFETGQKFGGFELFSVTPTEAVMGDDDVHLNFRISLLVDRVVDKAIDKTADRENGNGNELVLSTVVNINNKLGTVYMFFVKPFHRVIISIMIKKMEKFISEKSLPYYDAMEAQ